MGQFIKQAPLEPPPWGSEPRQCWVVDTEFIKHALNSNPHRGGRSPGNAWRSTASSSSTSSNRTPTVGVERGICPERRGQVHNAGSTRTPTVGVGAQAMRGGRQQVYQARPPIEPPPWVSKREMLERRGPIQKAGSIRIPSTRTPTVGVEKGKCPSAVGQFIKQAPFEHPPWVSPERRRRQRSRLDWLVGPGYPRLFARVLEASFPGVNDDRTVSNFLRLFPRACGYLASGSLYRTALGAWIVSGIMMDVLVSTLCLRRNRRKDDTSHP